MPLVATAEHSTAQKQACKAAASEVNKKTGEAEGETRGRDQQLRRVNPSTFSLSFLVVFTSKVAYEVLNASFRFDKILLHEVL